MGFNAIRSASMMARRPDVAVHCVPVQVPDSHVLANPGLKRAGNCRWWLGRDQDWVNPVSFESALPTCTDRCCAGVSASSVAMAGASSESRSGTFESG